MNILEQIEQIKRECDYIGFKGSKILEFISKRCEFFVGRSDIYDLDSMQYNTIAIEVENFCYGVSTVIFVNRHDDGVEIEEVHPCLSFKVDKVVQNILERHKNTDHKITKDEEYDYIFNNGWACIKIVHNDRDTL